MQGGAELLARHVSPDGALTLRVDRTIEADGAALVTVGFEQSGWHFHPTADEALGIVEEVLADRVVILISSVDGRIAYELMDDLEWDVDSKPADVPYRFRTWSREVTFDELVAGNVPFTPLSQLWNWRSEAATSAAAPR